MIPALRFCRAFLIAIAIVASTTASRAASDDEIAHIVSEQIRPSLPQDGRAGIAVVLRADDRTLFFNRGLADYGSGRTVTSDTLFNLGSVAKVFDTALLGQAVQQGELALDDPVAKYVTELQQGGDIRRVTFDQLATYTSGFVLPQDHPPWPDDTFTLARFISTLQHWKIDPEHQPGKQSIYSHAGFVLMHLAFERRFGKPFDVLLSERILKPLGLSSTTMPVASADPVANPRGEIPPALAQRAVQGYGEDGAPIGKPGNLQGYYHWLGTGQMYSSARDMAVFLAANLGQLPDHRTLQAGMRLAQQPRFPLHENLYQARAWEVRQGEAPLVDKYGGLNNSSAFIGMIPNRKLGVVILGNRGSLPVATAGRAMLLRLAGYPVPKD
jgi:beta-lactamase class C